MSVWPSQGLSGDHSQGPNPYVGSSNLNTAEKKKQNLILTSENKFAFAPSDLQLINSIFYSQSNNKWQT